MERFLEIFMCILAILALLAASFLTLCCAVSSYWDSIKDSKNKK